MFKKIYSIIAFFVISMGSLWGSELQDDIDKAATIIREFRELPENSIPKAFLNDAKGLAILSVVKAGFVFSGRAGTGLVIARTTNGWSAPSAIAVGGAGFGLQIGAEITDFVLILNTQDAIDAFSHGGNVTLGGDISVAAGPTGRTVEAGVAPTAAIYSYSISKGLFAGISLEGTVLVEREDANNDYYGRNVTPQQLLSGDVARPNGAKVLYKELKKF